MAAPRRARQAHGCAVCKEVTPAVANDLVPTENLSEAMRALRPKMRRFVELLFDGSIKPGHGMFTEAARQAGYEGSTPQFMSNIAQRLLANEKVQRAMTEQTRLSVRHEAPRAVAAMREIIDDVDHKDRAKMVMAVINRHDPEVSRVDVAHTVEVIDHKQASIDDLRRLKQLGTPREGLLAEFGNSLEYYERLLEEADRAKAAKEANIIEAEYTVVEAPADTPQEELGFKI